MRDEEYAMTGNISEKGKKRTVVTTVAVFP